MRSNNQPAGGNRGNPNEVARIARPESVVILAATVRASRELMRGGRVAGLKERVSEGSYAVPSIDLAHGVLLANV
jgi:anti-sigma28 factor (negative regulator of flagellin synthesis)